VRGPPTARSSLVFFSPLVILSPTWSRSFPRSARGPETETVFPEEFPDVFVRRRALGPPFTFVPLKRHLLASADHSLPGSVFFGPSGIALKPTPPRCPGLLAGRRFTPEIELVEVGLFFPPRSFPGRSLTPDRIFHRPPRPSPLSLREMWRPLLSPLRPSLLKTPKPLPGPLRRATFPLLEVIP